MFDSFLICLLLYENVVIYITEKVLYEKVVIY